jgi:geranylgeranyl pyrophosphate synthase
MTTAEAPPEVAPEIPPENKAVWDLPARMGLSSDLDRLRTFIAEWIRQTDPEVRTMIEAQLSGRAKYFRPVTIFACFRAIEDRAPSETVLTAAAGLELLHNVSLIVDDILDRSRYRRGKLSLHCRFGFLPALMASGYITAAASRLVAGDAYSVHLLNELMQRLGVAECLQWRLRRHAAGTEDWRAIAGEDTGSMFEICARLGTRDDRLRKFGRLLGILYHGCDDVADVRGTTALGGGSARDIEDAILTLPVAVAVRDPETALLFRNANPQNRAELTERLVAALPDAEDYLDGVAAEAESEALANARYPERLLALIRDTRLLSRA